MPIVFLAGSLLQISPISSFWLIQSDGENLRAGAFVDKIKLLPDEFARKGASLCTKQGNCSEFEALGYRLVERRQVFKHPIRQSLSHLDDSGVATVCAVRLMGFKGLFSSRKNDSECCVELSCWRYLSLRDCAIGKGDASGEVIGYSSDLPRPSGNFCIEQKESRREKTLITFAATIF